jgi:hypothetical protein
MPAASWRRAAAPLILASALIVLALVLVVPTAGAAPTPIGGGQALLTTDQAQTFVELWGANAVFMPVAPSTIAPGNADFLINSSLAGGSFDPATHRGTIRLKGGFSILSKQTMSAWTILQFTGVKLSLGATSTARGTFDGGATRTFATLDLSHATTTMSLKNGHVYATVRGIKARMTPWFFAQLKLALPLYAGPSHALGTYRVTMRLN